MKIKPFVVICLLILLVHPVVTLTSYMQIHTQTSLEPDFDLTEREIELENSDKELYENVEKANRLQFYENIGQMGNQDIHFYGQFPGGMILFAESKVILCLRGESKSIEIEFIDSTEVIPKGLEEANHRTNYLYGNSGSFTNVRGFAKIVYNDLWPGISLYYKATDEGAKYEFVVSPEVDPSVIRMRCTGPDQMLIESTSLLMIIGNKKISDSGLVAYQDEKEIEVEFESYTTDIYGFKLREYDSTRSLVIDPLIYSTFLGSSDIDRAKGIAVDESGCAYVTGWTESPNEFPVVNGYIAWTLSWDVFVSKLNPAGTDLVYSTYIGGGDFGESVGYAIAVDSSGCAYVTGSYGAPGFPITNGSAGGEMDCFVLKLNSTGNGMDFCRAFGSSIFTLSRSIAIASSGTSYIVGYTYDSSLSGYNGGSTDCFLWAVSNIGAEISLKLIGGSGKDIGESVAVDAGGYVYAAGWTDSDDIETYNELYDYNDGYDCFVAKYGPTGTLTYLTYIGGSEDDKAMSMAVDDDYNIYLGGTTNSADFPPTEGAFNSQYNGGIADCFILKLNAAGTDLIFSTFVGGINDDYITAMTVDSFGNSYVVGGTDSQDFPVTENAIFPNSAGAYDSLIFCLNAEGNDVLYSSYLGGSLGDWSEDITVDTDGNIYVTGYTNGTFPTTAGAMDETSNGDQDCFIYKHSETIAPEISATHSPSSVTYEDNIKITAVATDWGVGIDDVVLNYKTRQYGGDYSDWVSMVMTDIGSDTYEATIPKQDYGINVAYIVEVNDTVGNKDHTTFSNFWVLDDTPPTITDVQHIPASPTDSDTVVITANVTDVGVGLESVQCYYRIKPHDGSWGEWANASMNDEGDGTYSYTISSLAYLSQVQYYIFAVDIESNEYDTSSDTQTYAVGSDDTTGPSIGVSHSPTTITEIDDISITATVTDDNVIEIVTLQYSLDNWATWTNVTMTLGTSDWTAPIPRQEVGTIVRYRVYACDCIGNWGESTSGMYQVVTSDPPPDPEELFVRTTQILGGIAVLIGGIFGMRRWLRRRGEGDA